MNTGRPRTLHGDLRDLALVAAGAIPGALLRWRLEDDFIANMAGCLLLGVVLAQPPQRVGLMLAVGIGFCGSLTTFSSWMLELARSLQAGDPWHTLLVLLVSLLAGVALVGLGQALGRRRHR